MSKALSGTTILAIAVLGLAVTTTVAAPPVIINPSFEANGAVTYNGSGVLGTITGWSVSGQRVVILSTEGQTSGSFAAVFDDGLGSSTPPSGTHSAQLSQTITVNPNSDYAVFYDYGVFGGISQTQKLQVQAGSLNHTDIHTFSGVPTPFRKYAHPFTTDGSGSATLSFKDATTSGEIGSADGILDTIFIEEVAYRTSFEASESNYTITSSNVNPAHAAIVADLAYNGQAMDGTQFMAFNGGDGGVNEGNAIVTSTAFATTVGKSGHIFLDFGTWGGGTQSLKVELLDASNSSPYFTATVTDSTSAQLANTTMDAYLLTYTALATSTRLRITDMSGGPTGGSDALLDNIIVTIPEPSSLGLFGLGAFAFLWRVARRQSYLSNSIHSCSSGRILEHIV